MVKYTKQQVAEHNTMEDCWVSMEGKVFDISSYIKRHPGGRWILFKYVGGDIEQQFVDQSHSDVARELLWEMMIGELVEEEEKGKKEEGTEKKEKSGE